MCMYIYIYIYIHIIHNVCIHVYIYIYIYIFTYHYLCLLLFVFVICVYIYIYIYIHTYTYIYAAGTGDCARWSETNKHTGESRPPWQADHNPCLVMWASTRHSQNGVVIGWHYLSNATCLMRPRLFRAFFVPSMSTIMCYILHHCWRTPALDK